MPSLSSHLPFARPAFHALLCSRLFRTQGRFASKIRCAVACSIPRVVAHDHAAPGNTGPTSRHRASVAAIRDGVCVESLWRRNRSAVHSSIGDRRPLAASGVTQRGSARSGRLDRDEYGRPNKPWSGRQGVAGRDPGCSTTAAAPCHGLWLSGKSAETFRRLRGCRPRDRVADWQPLRERLASRGRKSVAGDPETRTEPARRGVCRIGKQPAEPCRWDFHLPSRGWWLCGTTLGALLAEDLQGFRL